MRKIFSNLYVYWAVIVGSILGGVMLIWQLADNISSNVSLILVDDPSGSTISNPNDPKIINVYLVFLVFFIIFILLIALAASLKELQKINPEKKELTQLRAQYNDILRFSKNIAQNFYDDNDDLMRTDPKAINISMTIETDGTTYIQREYELHCPAKPAHMFRIWVEADDETPGTQGHRKHRLRAKDLTRDREMDWIPVHDSLRRKEFIAFFPEMQPGETKRIRIEYTWPGYLNKLLQKGTAECWWARRSASSNTTADVRYEWLFKSGFPQIRAKLRGNISESATLTVNSKDEGVSWVYQNPRERLDNKSHRVLFELLTVDE